MVKEMTAIKGFDNVTFSELQGILFQRYKDLNTSYVDLAYKLKVKSISTVQNVLTGSEQMVSDQILSSILKILNVTGMVIWQDGERNYYIKN